MYISGIGADEMYGVYDEVYGVYMSQVVYIHTYVYTSQSHVTKYIYVYISC